MRRLGMVVLLALGTAAGAAAQTRWESVQTEHFLFLYEPRDRAAVDELLGFCEEVYARVTGFFHSYPEKVPCVIRGRLDYANGSTAPFPARLELILTAPLDDTFGGREPSWLRLLLTHELTHFVHLTMDRGVFHAASLLFGLDAAMGSAVFLPGWMIEGPAVELETLLTEGGRGKSKAFENTWKARVIEGRTYSLSQASYASSYPPRDRIYVAGYFLIDYLRRTYGEDTFRRIMDLYMAFPFFGPWGALQKVTGKTGEEVYGALLEEGRRRYADPPEGGALLTPDRIADFTAPRPTARGLYVYRSDLEHEPGIVRLGPDGSEEEVIAAVPLADPYSYAASADGRTLWYSSLSFDWTPPDGERASADISVREDGKTRQLTHEGHLWQPAVSADGSVLLAVQGRGPGSRLVALDPGTGMLRVLFSRAGGRVSEPAVSPDGRTAAFVLSVDGLQDVYVMDAAQAAAAAAPQADPREPMADVNPDLARPVLGPDPEGKYHPAFADGDTLLFSSDRTGSLCLYAADLPSGRVTLILQDPVAAMAGVKAGGSLVYQSYSSNGSCLKAVPWPEGKQMETGAAGLALGVPATRAFAAMLPAARPYADLPLSLLWFPTASLSVTAPAGIDIGAGLTALGSSLLGTSSWSARALWLTGSSQPAASLSASASLGTVRALYSGSLDYAYTGAYVQSLVNSLSFSVPVFSWTRLNSASSLWLDGGAAHIAELASTAPFTAARSAAAAWQQYIEVSAGAGWRWVRGGSPRDFSPPLDFGVSLGVLGEPPLLSSAGWGGMLRLRAAAAVPSPLPHQVVRLGAKASYALGTFGGGGDALASPRGFPDVTLTGTPGALLGSLDYVVSVALLDQPLFFGVGLLGIGAAVHLEHLSGWDAAGPAFTPGRALYPGAEVTLLLGYAGQSLPVGVGVAARVDTRAPAAFDPARDLRPYLFLSFDSFRDAAVPGAVPNPTGAWYTRPRDAR